LVFGYFIPNFDGLHFIGSPLATTLARFIKLFLIIFTIWILKLHKKTWSGFNIQDTLNWEEIKIFLKLGIPGSMMICLNIWGVTLYAIPASYLGKNYLAAQAVVMNLLYVGSKFPLALMKASTILIGNYVGSGDEKSAKSVMNYSLLLGMGKFLLF
jgi:multidrug resistance protein, MATE family